MKTDVFYTDVGEGLPVIFLHGYCETHYIWEEFSRKISKSHRVITLDLPGFGESSLPDGNFSLSDIAEMVHDKLADLGINRSVMIGHSLGGYITLAYAAKYESEISGFGLFHSSAITDTEEKKENRTKLIGFIEINGVRPFINTFIPSLFYENRRQEMGLYMDKLTLQALKTPARSIQQYAKAMRDREDTTRILRSFAKPVMMIIGENDNSVPFAKSIEQSKLIQRPYILTLKETGHMGMFERPADSLHFVQNFLNVCQ